MSFDEFKRQVIEANLVIYPGNPNPDDAVNQNGTYQMFGGNKERLLFSVVANRADPDLSGILAVGETPEPRISKWTFASGDIMQSDGGGRVTFVNAKLGQTIIWDFSNAQHPTRTPDLD